MKLLRCLFLISLLPLLIFAQTEVLFLNPGGEGDPFFQKMTDFMYLAADDLNIDLEVIYCDRDHIKLEAEVLNIIKREEKPKYLMLINEKDAVAPLLSSIDSAQIYFYLFNEGVLSTPSDEISIESMDYCLGELLPNDYNAGELLAEELYKQTVNKMSGEDTISIIGLAGVTATSSSITREQGFFDFFNGNPTVSIKQIVPAYHDREKATFVTSGLLERYGSVDLIWSASDIMALGAREVFQADQIPVIGGIDWSDEAIESIRNNNLSVSVGGHFLDGARVLISIAKSDKFGIDTDNFEIHRSSFSVITNENLHSFTPFFESIATWESVDFSQFLSSTIVPEQISANKFLEAYNEVN